MPARRRQASETGVVADLQSHSFVLVKDGLDGIGKFIQLRGTVAEVEYFISPAGPELKRVRVPRKLLDPIELPPQTRVYRLNEDLSAWQAGRIEGGRISPRALRLPVEATEDHYLVHFPNQDRAFVPQSRLFVRWAHPILDPTDYLAARVTETPFFSDGRTRIVRFLAGQREAFGGLTALASSAVELLEHQVSTVRRILADPVQRYLLADEVGLGKTIEAGILIRQHVIDCSREARVLVVVPHHLVRQWRDELQEKFFLRPDGPVTVLSEQEFVNHAPVETSPTMLVVDEAHRVALRAFSTDHSERRFYEALCHFSLRVPRLLLLSGTPVLHQTEDGFLAMLHLLDPDGYPLTNRELFRRRVQDRQGIAEATADLGDDASAHFVQEAIERLETLLGDDTRLVQLCRQVRSCINCSLSDRTRIAALRALRVHMTETYRLHRRLLRTRRDDPRLSDHLPQRLGAITIEASEPARREAFDLAETWRRAIPSICDPIEKLDKCSQLFNLWIEAALTHPRVLVRYLDARLALKSGQEVRNLTTDQRNLLATPWIYEGEQQLLLERRKLIATHLHEEPRTVELLRWLEGNQDVRKVVVFASDSEVADDVCARLIQGLGNQSVSRRTITNEGEVQFLADPRVRVLVCDISGEEGLNLQRVGAAVVHYDLPLDPGRIEQRIGRIDRIAAHGRLRNLVFSSTCDYEHEWLDCLSNAIRIFNRSVAPLQYMLLDSTARIRTALATEGCDAIQAETKRLLSPTTGLDVELRRIRQQEILDSLEFDTEEETRLFEMLTSADTKSEEEGREAFEAWVVKILQFVRRECAPHVFRYTLDLGRPTLIPLFELATRSSDVVDRSTRRSSEEFPLQPCTFERWVAEEKHVGLLRVGHPFMNAIETLIRVDDRGSAFAMWRHIPRWSSELSRWFFRFDFFIEADTSRAQTLLENRLASPEALRRRADTTFPVCYRTIYLDSDFVEVRDPKTITYLEMPFSKNPRPDGGCDVNLRLDRWADADRQVPVGDWGELCQQARKKAEALLRARPEFTETHKKCARVVRENAIATDHQLQSRISRLNGSVRNSEESAANLERQLAEALAEGIETPTVRVDSVGALCLSAEPLLPRAR